MKSGTHATHSMNEATNEINQLNVDALSMAVVVVAAIDEWNHFNSKRWEPTADAKIRCFNETHENMIRKETRESFTGMGLSKCRIDCDPYGEKFERMSGGASINV